jgi:hypothetical protein
MTMFSLAAFAECGIQPLQQVSHGFGFCADQSNARLLADVSVGGAGQPSYRPVRTPLSMKMSSP